MSSTSTALVNVFGEARGAEIIRQASAEAVRVREQLAIERQELAEERSSLENPQTSLSFPAEWLLDAWGGGGNTDAGIRINEMTALTVSTVFSCVDMISSAIGSLDWNVYERFTAKNKRVGRRLSSDHYIFDLLQTEPNPEMTAYTYRKSLMVHALLWGNQYAEIQRNGAGRPIAFWPRNPGKTRPHRVMSSGLLVYKTSDGMDYNEVPGQETRPDGPERTIFAENMLHVPGLAIDARLGQSVAWLSRQVFGLALAAEKFGSKLFANAARPSGVLMHPGKLNQKAKDETKQTWESAHTAENAHRIALLENGIKFEKVAATAEEAQNLETRAHQRIEVCSLFHFPPHMIGVGPAGGKNNLEQVGGEFITFTLGSWLKALTQEYERKLFPKVGQTARKFFPGFDTKPFVLADFASRKDYYAAGKQWGYLCTDDILEYEHLNPTEQPGSDLYWMPVNVGIMSAEGAIIPASQAAANAGGDPNADPGAPPADPKAKDKAPSATRIGKRLARSYSDLFVDTFRRIQARKDADSETFKRALLPVFLTVTNQLIGEGSAVWQIEEIPAAAESRFLIDLIEGIRKRVVEGETAEQSVERELPRVIRAIAIDTFRNMATQVAKNKTEDVTP